MPSKIINPALLEGDELRRWYQRSPEEIQNERQAAEDDRYRSFFGREVAAPLSNPTVSATAAAGSEDAVWIANGRGGYSKVRSSDFDATLEPERFSSSHLPENLATDEHGELIDVGNPYNPRLKREWERAEGQAWPKTADGRPYDVAHKRAIADGGTNTLANIRPMDPKEHRESHAKDSGRWGKRSSIARAFGGKVEPPINAYRPNRGGSVKGLGAWNLIPSITGVLSGRIRTDTPQNFWYDALGVPNPADDEARRRAMRSLNTPGCPPGWDCI